MVPDPVDVVPGNRRSKQLRNDRAPANSRGGSRREKRFEVAEARNAVTNDDIAQPTRVAQHVEPCSQRRFPGAQVIAPVPLAAAEDIRVGGEHQRLVTGGVGPLHDVLGNGPILHDVQLHPQPPAGGGGNIFQARRCDRAQTEWDARGGGRFGQREVPLWVQHPVHAGRGDDEGRGRRLAEELDLVVALGRIDQRIGHEVQ